MLLERHYHFVLNNCKNNNIINNEICISIISKPIYTKIIKENKQLLSSSFNDYTSTFLIKFQGSVVNYQ